MTTGNRYEIRIPTLPGLARRVQPAAQKVFVVRYSHDGKYRKLTLCAMAASEACGVGPEVSDVRLARDPNSTPPDAPRSTVRRWRPRRPALDPAAQKSNRQSHDRRNRSLYLVKVLWQKFLDKPTKKGQGQTTGVTQAVRAPIFAPSLAKWGEKRITPLKKAIVKTRSAAAKLRGDHAAVSVHMVLSAFFTWCEKRGDILKSPLKGLDRPAAESNSERDLTDDELKTIWGRVSPWATRTAR